MSERESDRKPVGAEGAEPEAARAREPWAEPRLEYIEPRLVKHGEMKQITGFIGTFVPED